ncbi:hypothetical protein BD410DRAFT_795779 [Rickenella mellea]|uniref:Uncharacterized protein n=1 Tax=Rickenella mellea TaxID=50990 RepID=A0A4Y7PMI2_9AGAM|nr:hypothetical protein BD410DRAFT_795779 [Rickenella mellea]
MVESFNQRHVVASSHEPQSFMARNKRVGMVLMTLHDERLISFLEAPGGSRITVWNTDIFSGWLYGLGDQCVYGNAARRPPRSGITDRDPTLP